MQIPSNLKIFCTDAEEHETEFIGEIKEIHLNGTKINDVHDLTEKVSAMTRTIKFLAWTATGLAVIAVVTVIWLASWLLSHDSSMDQLLLTGNKRYDQQVWDASMWNSHCRERAWIHLQKFQGLHWDEGIQDWVNHPFIKGE